MDAPLLPGAESSNGADGGLPPGQASAFRRALDAQVESADPAAALVPSGPHDLTRPIDVSALRAALTASQAPAQPRESAPGFPQAATGADAAATTVIAETAVADLSAVLPQAAAAAPSPGGPTVVVPAVSVPGLRATTTIATPTPKFVVPRGEGGGAAVATAPPPGPGGENGHEQEHSPRHSGGSGGPSRISTTIGVSVLLAAIAATALVLVSVGRSSGPLAPDAMPTRSVTQSPVAAAPPHSAKPSHKPSPSPSHAPGHSPSPSPSPSKPSPSPSTVTNFATIRWSSQYEPVVANIQSRLAKLRYLALDRNGTQYDVTQHTVMANGNRWWQPSDQIGYYQNATSLAIRAFEYDYLQHDQGQPPGDGSCDAATYQALIDATS